MAVPGRDSAATKSAFAISWCIIVFAVSSGALISVNERQMTVPAALSWDYEHINGSAASTSSRSSGGGAKYSQLPEMTPMKASEKEAFYEVVEALNAEWQWRELYPDPCGVNELKGITCEPWERDGLWYFAEISFGPLYDNSPLCGSSKPASIHPSIGKLARLRSLSFYHCFTKFRATLTPAVVGLRTSLQHLAIRDNPALEGGIPAEYSGLDRLERLVVTGNPRLRGGIPAEIGSLGGLRQLDLSENELEGEIPGSVGGLERLVVLDLSRNRLRGQLPVGVGQLRELQKLDCSGNGLGGGIGVLGGARELRLVDLSQNQLRGGLQPSLAGLRYLTYLSLAHNPGLGGPLPESIWPAMKDLATLDLSWASFAGPIPASLAALPSLQCLSLHHNMLSGPIPPSLPASPRLAALYLAHNDLSGPIPPLPPAFLLRLGPHLSLDHNPRLCFSRTSYDRDLAAATTTFMMIANVNACSSNASSNLNVGTQPALSSASPDLLGSFILSLCPNVVQTLSVMLICFLQL